jgi:hypothetical protein
VLGYTDLPRCSFDNGCDVHRGGGVEAVELDERVTFPDIDVRQRLTDLIGYGVAEIVVHQSTLIGRADKPECGAQRRWAVR